MFETVFIAGKSAVQDSISSNIKTMKRVSDCGTSVTMPEGGNQMPQHLLRSTL